MSAFPPKVSPALDLAIAMAARGFDVFPLKGKASLARWKSEASSEAAAVERLFRLHRTADGVGWRIPHGFVVADVDDAAAFAATGLGLPAAPGQRTPSGGEHRLYLGGGRQTVKETPGLDTRVGGKGYVRLYSADAFEGEAPDAPTWLLHEERAERGPSRSADGEPMGSRDEILSWLGRFARVERQDEAVYLALLNAARDSGRIVDLDPGRPWTSKDLRALAREAARWEPSEDTLHEDLGRRLLEGYERFKERWDARRSAKPNMSLVTIGAPELLAKQFRPLVEPVPGLVVEGLGMLIGGPKKGKSWLAYQFAVAVATGGEVLGRRALKGDVLYLALEDGERRAQSRIQTVLRHMGRAWPADAAELRTGFNAERGDALVQQVEEWLGAHPAARLVIVDTLQKIRPASSGRRNQYELDVEDLGRVLAISQRHPGLSILLVHHDRKQVAPDFLDAASGTHGITGSVDTALVLKRERHEEQGTLEVTGRDVREDVLYLAYDEGDPFWAIDPQGGMTDQQVQAWEWLRDNGPASPSALGDALGIDRSNAHRLLQTLVRRQIVVAEGGLYRLPINAPRKGPDNDDNADNADNDDNEDNEG